MRAFVDTLNGFIWSDYLVYLCLGAGLFFSILTRFVQVRLVGEMIRLLFKGVTIVIALQPHISIPLGNVCCPVMKTIKPTTTATSVILREL